jgi:hypothetical protein
MAVLLPLLFPLFSSKIRHPEGMLKMSHLAVQQLDNLTMTCQNNEIKAILSAPLDSTLVFKANKDAISINASDK